MGCVSSVDSNKHKKVPMHDSEKCGISLDRIVNRREKASIVDLYLCKICLRLSMEPVIDRSKCQSIFCSGCIHNYMKRPNSNTCPLRCPAPRFEPVNRVEATYMKDLAITCKNRKRGCPAIVTYEGLVHHEASCHFKAPSNPAPNYQNIETDKQWNYSHVECEGCGKQIIRQESGAHRCQACSITRIEEVKIEQPNRTDFARQEEADIPWTLKRNLYGHKDVVMAMLQLSDGRLASSSRDNTVKLWDLETGDCVSTLVAKNLWVWELLEMRDKRLATASDDGRIRVWNLSSEACEIKIKNKSCAYSIIELDNNRMVVSLYSGTIKVWNLETKECEKKLKEKSGTIFKICLLRDGRILSSSGKGNLSIWNIDTGICDAVIDKAAPHWSYSVEMLYNGNMVAGTSDGKIKLWNMLDLKCDKTLTVHSEAIRKIAQVDKTTVITASDDKTVKVTNIETGSCLKSFDIDTVKYASLAVLRGGGFAIGLEDKHIQVWH